MESALTLQGVLRGVVAPVLAGFVFCTATALYAAHRPVVRPPRSRAVRSLVDLGLLLRYVAVTAVGGYFALLAIIFVFGVLILGDTGALRSAALGSLFLLAVATPVFVLLSWAFGRRTS